MEKEIWKDIDGYDGMYQVSNKGRVRSWKNNRWEGKSNNPKILKPTMHGVYEGVNLYMNAKEEKHYIHRLVATYFMPNPEDKPQVNHKNLNKLDNSASNLEWVTDHENKLHAINKDMYATKLKRDTVLKILSDYKEGLSTYDLADKYDVARSTAGRIVNGTTWSHITRGLL